MLAFTITSCDTATKGGGTFTPSSWIDEEDVLLFGVLPDMMRNLYQGTFYLGAGHNFGFVE